MERTEGDELDLIRVSDVLVAVDEETGCAGDHVEFFGLVHVVVHGGIEDGPAMFGCCCWDNVAHHLAGLKTGPESHKIIFATKLIRWKCVIMAAAINNMAITRFKLEYSHIWPLGQRKVARRAHLHT